MEMDYGMDAGGRRTERVMWTTAFLQGGGWEMSTARILTRVSLVSVGVVEIVVRA